MTARLVFLVLGLVPAAAAAWVPSHEPASTWADDALPVEWFLNEDGSRDLGIEAVEEQAILAFRNWARVDCCAVSFTYGGRTRASANGSRDQNVVSWTEAGWGHDASAIAVAGTMFSGSRIVEADIDCNGVNYTWNVGGGGGVDTQSILTHEIGHFLGLGDLYDTGHSSSTMYRIYSNGTEERSLAEDDMEGCRALYPQECGRCGSDFDCPERHHCIEEVCQPDSSGSCTTDAECPSGYRCLGSECITRVELCDGLDNDGDTLADENRVCGPACVAWAETDACDGNDEDCDGIVDPGCSCPDGADPRPCGVDSGRCSLGVQACAGGVWSETCTGAVLPRVELCDGEDNDCDGTTDEDVCAVDGGGEDDGCGCAVPGSGSGAAFPALAVVLGILGFAVRERRRRARRREAP